jgi:hypothetical protein
MGGLVEGDGEEDDRELDREVDDFLFQIGSDCIWRASTARDESRRPRSEHPMAVLVFTAIRVGQASSFRNYPGVTFRRTRRLSGRVGQTER